MGFTSSDNEDSGAAAGWSIANGGLWAGNISTSTWSTSTNARQIAVYGYAKAAQTPTPTRLRVDTPAANTIRRTLAAGASGFDYIEITTSLMPAARALYPVSLSGAPGGFPTRLTIHQVRHELGRRVASTTVTARP